MVMQRLWSSRPPQGDHLSWSADAGFSVLNLGPSQANQVIWTLSHTATYDTWIPHLGWGWGVAFWSSQAPLDHA